MDEQTQKKFIEWLSQQLQVQSPEELEGKLQELGDEGIKKAFDMFTKQQITPTSQQMMSNGGKFEYLKRLQQGGKMTASAAPVTNRLGDVVNDKDLNAYKKAGIDFGTKQAMADWLGTWGKPVTQQAMPAQASAPAVAPNPQLIQRYNQNLMSYEKVPVQQIMGEPNSMTVGQAPYFSKWDLSQFKKYVKPTDTIGQPKYIKDNVQQAWTQNKITHNKEGGQLEVQKTKEEMDLDYIKCLKELKKGGKMKSATKCGCAGSKIMPMKGAGGSIKDGGGIHSAPKTKGAVKKLQPKKVIMGQGADGVMGNSKIHG